MVVQQPAGAEGTHTLALVIWVVCGLGFLLTSLAFIDMLVPHALQRSLAIIFVLPSLLGLIFYWQSFAQLFNKVGALGVNLGILVRLLVMNWPSEAEIGF